jgi:hypothetical protein
MSILNFISNQENADENQSKTPEIPAKLAKLKGCCARVSGQMWMGSFLRPAHMALG